eukprot:1306996-Rhodomonas_salina.1
MRMTDEDRRRESRNLREESGSGRVDERTRKINKGEHPKSNAGKHPNNVYQECVFACLMSECRGQRARSGRGA